MTTQPDRRYRIVALPGEGIGPEVVEASLTILQVLASVEGFTVSIERGLIGEPAREQFGVSLPQETLSQCECCDGILFGSVNRGGLLELRQHFDLFINLRPIRPLPSLMDVSPIKADRLKDVDILVIRELVSGIYFGPSERGIGRHGAYGSHTMRYQDSEIRRIARVALGYAQERRRHLTIAHKENALPHIPWTRLVQEEARQFPAVTIQPVLVDNLAMQLVMNPQAFDVILAGNLFGDILSDLGGALVGSLGMLGSASLNADGFGLYEAVHGTAPDIAGKGIANPLGTLTATTLMLDQWGEHQAAERLRQLQNTLLVKGYRTADLYQRESHLNGPYVDQAEHHHSKPLLDHHLAPLQTKVTTAELVNLFVDSLRAQNVSSNPM
ncbi:MAG: isocitrate/isopropylmalate family dehydrogenase [Cyanobacteria bacterium J06626_14]